MKIQEVSKQMHITKRAIKFYEEKGLLKVSKDENGYRNYTKDDIRILKKISIYRKLGIAIKDIKYLLEHPEDELSQMNAIYNDKKKQIQLDQKQLESLKLMIDSNISEDSIQQVDEILDYATIADALKEMIPGYAGQIFMYHFLPYLQITIQTQEQQDAYDAIVEFWDNVSIKIPMLMRINGYIQKNFFHMNMKDTAAKLDQEIQSLLYPTDEEYNKTKKMIQQNVKIKNSLLYKYHPFLISNRKFMKRLQNCGYNDIFIQNMKKLSPKYREYHDALTALNDRICADLGLYYDSNYNLIMKK